MNEYAVVSTKSELKDALRDEIENIIVTDSRLAKSIKTVKYSSKAILVVAIGAAGTVATNFWNPVGLTAGIVGGLTAGTTITAIIVLGLGTTFIYAIYNGYTIKAKTKFTTVSGEEIEGEIVLEKK